MKKSISLFALVISFTACQPAIEKYGQHYQKNGDHQSLQQVMDLLKADADTAYIRQLLGEPIDMGFDIRYLTEKAGANGCVIGAVFHINAEGKVDQRWIDEICE